MASLVFITISRTPFLFSLAFRSKHHIFQTELFPIQIQNVSCRIARIGTQPIACPLVLRTSEVYELVRSCFNDQY